MFWNQAGDFEEPGTPKKKTKVSERLASGYGRRPASDAQADCDHHHKRRTVGMKIFHLLSFKPAFCAR